LTTFNLFTKKKNSIKYKTNTEPKNIKNLNKKTKLLIKSYLNKNNTIINKGVKFISLQEIHNFLKTLKLTFFFNILL